MDINYGILWMNKDKNLTIILLSAITWLLLINHGKLIISMFMLTSNVIYISVRVDANMWFLTCFSVWSSNVCMEIWLTYISSSSAKQIDQISREYNKNCDIGWSLSRTEGYESIRLIKNRRTRRLILMIY